MAKVSKRKLRKHMYLCLRGKGLFIGVIYKMTDKELRKLYLATNKQFVMVIKAKDFLTCQTRLAILLMIVRKQIAHYNSLPKQL